VQTNEAPEHAAEESSKLNKPKQQRSAHQNHDTYIDYRYYAMLRR
jgi:hypothetical protein